MHLKCIYTINQFIYEFVLLFIFGLKFWKNIAKNCYEIPALKIVVIPAITILSERIQWVKQSSPVILLGFFYFLRWYQLCWSSPCYFPYFLNILCTFRIWDACSDQSSVIVKYSLKIFLLCFLSIDNFSFFVNFFVSFFSYSSLCWQLPHFNLPSMVYVNLSLVIIFEKKFSSNFFLIPLKGFLIFYFHKPSHFPLLLIQSAKIKQYHSTFDQFSLNKNSFWHC